MTEEKSENKKIYAEFCKQHELQIPIFFQPWWLDAVCQEGRWEAFLFRRDDGTLKGVWPVFIKKKYGIPVITNPPLTPYLGPWFDNEDESVEGYEVSGILKQLQWVAFHNFRSTHVTLNEFVFQKHGFEKQKSFTYILNRNIDANSLFGQFRPSTKQRIRTAMKNLNVRESATVIPYIDFIANFLVRKKIFSVPLLQALIGLVTETIKRQKGKLFCAFDKEENLHSIVFIVWDSTTTYCLLTANKQDMKFHGNRLLIWHAIQDAVTRGHFFDFEGGEIPSIGDFFASFGAQKTPIFNAKRYANPMIKRILNLFGY